MAIKCCDCRGWLGAVFAYSDGLKDSEGKKQTHAKHAALSALDFCFFPFLVRHVSDYTVYFSYCCYCCSCTLVLIRRIVLWLFLMCIPNLCLYLHVGNGNNLVH